MGCTGVCLAGVGWGCTLLGCAVLRCAVLGVSIAGMGRTGTRYAVEDCVVVCLSGVSCTEGCLAGLQWEGGSCIAGVDRTVVCCTGVG